MLYEILKVKQDDPAVKMRWFTAENCDSDLYVWQDMQNGQIVQFQFYFDRHFDEKVVEWKGGESLYFGKVKDETLRGPKAAPIVIRQAELDLEVISQIFCAKSGEIEHQIREFVSQKLVQRLPRAS